VVVNNTASNPNNNNNNNAQTGREELEEIILGSLRKFNLEEKDKDTPISKMTGIKVATILDSIGLTVLDIPQDEYSWTAVSCSAFVWGGVEDDMSSTAATNHFRTQLATLGLIGRDKFAVHAVHKNKQLYSTQLGPYCLNGGVDAVIVPYKVAEYFCANHVRVVIDWKLPSNISYESCYAQAFGKMKYKNK